MNNRQLKRYLEDGGPGMPPARRKAQLKKEYAVRVAALRPPDVVERRSRGLAGGKARLRGLPTFAKIAVAAVAVVAVLVGTGFGSAYAMPGNVLYPVKRLIEGVHLSFTGEGEARADAHLAYANRRIDELEYVSDREMADWYGALASGAQERIEAVYGEAPRVRQRHRARHLEAARSAEARLEAVLGSLEGEIPVEDMKELERIRMRVRERLGTGGGSRQGPGDQGGPPADDVGDAWDGWQQQQQYDQHETRQQDGGHMGDSDQMQDSGRTQDGYQLRQQDGYQQEGQTHEGYEQQEGYQQQNPVGPGSLL